MPILVNFKAELVLSKRNLVFFKKYISNIDSYIMQVMYGNGHSHSEQIYVYYCWIEIDNLRHVFRLLLIKLPTPGELKLKEWKCKYA